MSSGSTLANRTVRSSREYRLRSFATRVILTAVISLGWRTVEAATFVCAGGDVLCLVTSINQANANGQTNIISLASGTYTLTMPIGGPTGPNGLPQITSTMTILGGNAATVIIERDATAPDFRILSVAASGDLTIQGVTLRNGRGFGGSGISNSGGAVRLVATILSGNGSPLSPGAGGIANSSGLVTITHSILTGNQSNSGGATITTNGTMYIDHTRITQNSGNLGTGGLQQTGGFVNINGSTFDHNGADGPGAIQTGVFGQPATLVISDSAFIENRAGGLGVSSGAALGIGQATVSVTNTTFARNIHNNFGNGSLTSSAIHNFAGQLTLTNSTIADNIQGPLLPTPIIHAALVTQVGATTVLQNTILARNTDNPLGQDCIGPITSLGNNLIGDLTGCSVVLQPSDLTGNPGLGTFTDNGTPGNGHVPLLPTSRAINAANTNVCPIKDQIGQPRIPHCDIGAVEFSQHTHNVTLDDELVQNVP